MYRKFLNSNENLLGLFPVSLLIVSLEGLRSPAVISGGLIEMRPSLSAHFWYSLLLTAYLKV
jgi:hypothetical protein